MNNLYDRRIDTLIENYSSEVSGAIAIKEATKGLPFSPDGIESEYGLRLLISKESDHRTHKILSSTVDSLYGRALYDPEEAMHRVVNVAKNFTNVDLVLSLFSMGGEMATAAAHAFFGKSGTARRRFLTGIENVVRSVVGKDAIANTALERKLMNFYGLGSAMIRKDHYVRTADAISGVAESVGDTLIESTSNHVRMAALKVSQNVRADDFMKQVGMLYHTERLAMAAEGKLRLSDATMRQFGITQDFLDKLKVRRVTFLTSTRWICQRTFATNSVTSVLECRFLNPPKRCLHRHLLKNT